MAAGCGAVSPLKPEAIYRSPRLLAAASVLAYGTLKTATARYMSRTPRGALVVRGQTNSAVPLLRGGPRS